MTVTLKNLSQLVSFGPTRERVRKGETSSSPKRKGDERPNADVVPGRHPERWRKDAAGIVVCKRFCNCQGCLCFEYDHIVPFSKDKDLDIIEMAVYGDVIRPGNQCRCRTVAEMLGRHKSKDQTAACKLP